MPTAPQPLRARKPRWPAAPPRPAPVVDYPDRGVEPMTPKHWDATVDCKQPLRKRYAQRDDVYVGSELTMYWLEGNDQRSVQPDVFVAFGPSRDRERDVWKVWEEGKLADFVLEVTSKSTRGEDEGRKRDIYRRMGVTEYWQFDPTGDYLNPRLKGRRLNARRAYRPIPLTTAPDGTLYGESKVLALHLCPDGRHLRLFDPATGEFLPTNDDKDDLLAEERRASAAKDRIIDDKDRIIEQLNRRLADR